MIVLLGHPSREGGVNPEPRSGGGSAAVVPRVRLLTSSAVVVRSLGRGLGTVNDVKVEECMGLQEMRALLD